MKYLYHVRLVPHFPDFRHIAQLLLDQRSLKRHQHEESEDAVIPVSVKAPQTNTEHLQREP